MESGFLLLELITTVAILSLGLIFLGRSFIASLDAAKAGNDYTEAVSLAENKLCELELEEYISNSTFPSEPVSKSGDFGQGHEGFNWIYTVNELNDDNSIGELGLRTSWQKPRRRGEVNLNTFMYIKE